MKKTHQETIVALATPSGAGGIAIIRISGPDSAAVIRRIHSRADQAISSPRTLVLGRLLSDGSAIDQGLVVYMPGPKSYTGEDVAELQVHTSPAIIKLLLEAAVQFGSRLAEPGEFTKRAYLNGKLDLAQAEAVADVIAASSTSAVKLATAQLAGSLSRQVGEQRAALVGIVAMLVANLDFGEEDIPDIDADELLADLQRIQATMNSWLASSKQGMIMRHGLAVAIVGLPNAGKSSLLNALIGYERAIVTNIAGTTRDTLEEQIEIDGLAVRIVDTAGLTETSDVVEGIGVARAHLAAEEADLVLLCAAADQDLGQLKFKPPKGIPMIGVQTKIDELSGAIGWPKSVEKSVATSAKTGQGLDELRHVISQAAGETGSGEMPVLANLRHIEAVRESLGYLEQTIQALEDEAPLDIVAGELTLAAEALSSIVGENVGKEIIDAVFSKFCIGK